MKNDPNQRGIRSVRGMENEKRSETARDSERSRNRNKKTLQISEEFGSLVESNLRNSPHCESGFNTLIEFQFFCCILHDDGDIFSIIFHL
ncbi:hypothetical protein ACM26V_11535 [Salipaludibacillus sp. HK11]|uniref:hypothetical protein n=1 Tax=Salipaludibacillus sp. HK11 TaxID=3394320 RepID=UPI0039FBED82